MYSYKTGLGQVWVGSKLPPNPANNIIWLRPSDDHRVLWEIRTYNIYKERWEVLTSAALTADGLLILIRDLEKRCKSLEELKVVLYDTIQNLTPEEQKIARQNIGAISLEDLPPQVEVLQEVGSSTTAVMSQNAVTEELSKKASVESVTDGISAHNTSSTSHADIRKLLNTCVGLPAYDSSSYKITFTTLAGASVEIDLPIEQLALRYNAETESIEFDNADGTTTSIPVSAFVKEYVGSIGDRIQISIDENNAIHATVLKNSIDWNCLSVELQERINDHVTSVDFATKAVRTDITQNFSASEQAQALANLGMKVYVTDSSFLGSTLSAEEIEQVAASKVLLFTDTGDLFLLGTLDSNRITFTRSASNSIIAILSITRSTGVVSALNRYNFQDALSLHFTAQNPALTSAQQSQAFKNLGWKVHVISESAIGSSDAVSDDEKAARLSATTLLVQETGLLYNFSITSGGSRRFYGQFSNSFCTALNVNEATGVITSSFAYLYDPSAVSFNRDQSSVSDDNKNNALGNIGLDFVRIDYSVIGTTLDDQLFNQIANAKGLVVNNHPNGLCVYTRARGIGFPVNFFTIRDATTITACTLRDTDKKLTLSGTFAFSANCVYYVKQTLTNTQKQQALSNIGLPLVHVDYSLIGSTLDDSTYNKLLTAKGVLLENVPDGNNAPSLYFVGASDTVTTIFVSEFNARVWFVLTLSHTSKKLSLVSTGYASDVVRYGVSQILTDAHKQQARSNINAVGSSMIKGVEIVYGTAPMQEDNILYIELEETT